MSQQRLRVIFSPKAEIMLSHILRKNGLEESLDQYFDAVSNGRESREIIVRNSAEILVKKMLPEAKLVGLLEKHLEISPKAAEQLLREITKDLLPLLVAFPDEKFNDPIFRDKVAKEIFGEVEPLSSISSPIKEKPIPFSKEVETKNVEENAKKMEKNLTSQKQEIITQEQSEPSKVKTVLPQEEKKGPDSYREPIE